MITFPATKKLAPNHHIGGNDSEKMTKPSRAVSMKFEEVLRMETWVVEGERERAFVKRAHMMPLKRRLSAKKIWRMVCQRGSEETGRTIDRAIRCRM